MKRLLILGALASMAQHGGTIDPANDPHNGRFTTGGRTCARCHAKDNPRAEAAYRMALQMAKMVDALNYGPLRDRPVDCVACHRKTDRDYVFMAEDRVRFDAMQRITDHWPARPGDGQDVRRTMARYSVALGVACNYCHSPGDWKNDAKPAMKTARDGRDDQLAAAVLRAADDRRRDDLLQLPQGRD